MIPGAQEVFVAIGGLIAGALAILGFGQLKKREGAKDNERNMRIKDYEKAKHVRNRVDGVSVSDNDIKFRD